MAMNHHDIRRTPSWPAAQSAKAAWGTANKDPKASAKDKRKAAESYKTAMRKAASEAGLIRYVAQPTPRPKAAAPTVKVADPTPAAKPTEKPKK
jgi:hypothetical protein